MTECCFLLKGGGDGLRCERLFSFIQRGLSCMRAYPFSTFRNYWVTIEPPPNLFFLLISLSCFHVQCPSSRTTKYLIINVFPLFRFECAESFYESGDFYFVWILEFWKSLNSWNSNSNDLKFKIQWLEYFEFRFFYMKWTSITYFSISCNFRTS